MRAQRMSNSVRRDRPVLTKEGAGRSERAPDRPTGPTGPAKGRIDPCMIGTEASMTATAAEDGPA